MPSFFIAERLTPKVVVGELMLRILGADQAGNFGQHIFPMNISP